MQIVTRLPLISTSISRRGLLRALTLCVLPVFMAACTATQTLPTPGAGWESHTGQLLYRSPDGRSVIGEAVIRHSGRNEFALNFLSGPGFPLLKLQVSGDEVVAEGVFARGRWRGKTQNAPKALQGWIGLREVFAQLPANLTTGGWATKVRSTGTRVEHIETRFAPSGERFALHFGS